MQQLTGKSFPTPNIRGGMAGNPEGIGGRSRRKCGEAGPGEEGNAAEFCNLCIRKF